MNGTHVTNSEPPLLNHTSSLESPDRHSFPQQMAAIGAKITRALSRERTRDSEITSEEAMTRSISRGRDSFKSSMRGGYGNIHRTSTSREAAKPTDGPDDFSPTRGRELAFEADKVASTGRGGAGNIRSLSRSTRTTSQTVEFEKDVVKHHAEADKAAVHSSGRGGLGNISRSRSRGPGIAE